MRSSDLFVAAVPCVLLACVGWPSALTAADVSAPQAALDIEEGSRKVRLAFSGDLPVGIKYMRLLANRFVEQKIEGQIIGVFHGDAAYLTLNDGAYNTYRSVGTGNPYKALITELLKQGVQIEECAVSMKAHSWGNEDLLPGIKVNTGAVIRLIQLTQEGYTQIQP